MSTITDPVRLLDVAGQLRTRDDRVCVDTATLADLFEHVAGVWPEGHHSAHQWLRVRQLVGDLAEQAAG